MVTLGPVLFPFGEPSFQGAHLRALLVSPPPLRQLQPLLTTSVFGMAACTQAPVVLRHWFSYTSSSTWLLLMSTSRRSLGAARPQVSSTSPRTFRLPGSYSAGPVFPYQAAPPALGKAGQWGLAPRAGWRAGPFVLGTPAVGSRLQWPWAHLPGLRLTCFPGRKHSLPQCCMSRGTQAPSPHPSLTSSEAPLSTAPASAILGAPGNPPWGGPCAP